MARSFDELPSVQFTGEDIMSGRFPRLQAQKARELGPIYKWSIRDGWQPGDYVYMVGPEANRFVLHTGREHFSHDLGWTPIIGENFGHGLLNMDDPEHAVHRRMWNPAFTGPRMESYLPTMRRVIAEHCRTWVEQDEVDVYAEAREITFDIAAAALAGFAPGPQVDRLRELFYTLIHGFDPEQRDLGRVPRSSDRRAPGGIGDAPRPDRRAAPAARGGQGRSRRDRPRARRPRRGALRRADPRAREHPPRRRPRDDHDAGGVHAPQARHASGVAASGSRRSWRVCGVGEPRRTARRRPRRSERRATSTTS